MEEAQPREELMEYGYEPEEEKSWLDMIIDYIRSKKEAVRPKLEKTV